MWAEIVSFGPVYADAPTFLDLDQDSFRRRSTSVAFTTPPAVSGVGIPLPTIKLKKMLTPYMFIFIFPVCSTWVSKKYLDMDNKIVVKGPILYTFSRL